MTDKNKDTVSIWGKEYPLYILPTYDKDGKSIVVREENSVACSDFLPDFFAAQEKHFSKEEYYAKVLEKHPEYKKKWFESIPSEQDIEQFVIKQYGYGAMDGATSVPKAEKQLGIKIGGGYRYPQGMSDIEYHAHCFMQTGLHFANKNPTTKMEAYLLAWQELHYGSQEDTKEQLRKQCKELIELNPELKDVKFDWNNAGAMGQFQAGVTYNFPKEDIQLFIDENAKGVDGINKSRRSHVKELLKQKGIPDCFNWVLSDKTIDNIALRLKEKEGKTAEQSPQQQENVVNEAEKTPKEKVAEKLKSWGIEDGSYMMLTVEDNARVGYGGSDFRSTESYFEYGQKDIQKTGKDVVYGRNNGIYGAYFAEGVYVLSTNDKIGNALYRTGEDVGLGVMLSNGEKFESFALTSKWSKAKAAGDELNIRHEREEKEQKTDAANGMVSSMMKKIANIADKHDAGGELKEFLLDTYTKNDEKMLSLEFWGNVAQQYALKSPAGKDVCLQEFGSLGLNLCKEIKENKHNEFYKEAKKSAASERDNLKKNEKTESRLAVSARFQRDSSRC